MSNSQNRANCAKTFFWFDPTNVEIWLDEKNYISAKVAIKCFWVKSTSPSIIITSLSRTNGSDGSFDGSLMVSRNQVINKDQENMFKILSFGSKLPSPQNMMRFDWIIKSPVYLQQPGAYFAQYFSLFWKVPVILSHVVL